MTAPVIAVCFKHRHLLPCKDCQIRRHARVIWDARIAAREVRERLEAVTREPSQQP